MWKTFKGFLHVAIWGKNIVHVGEKVNISAALASEADDETKYRQRRDQALLIDAQLAFLRRELSVYRGDFIHEPGQRQST